jgi:hypothetical protein
MTQLYAKHFKHALTKTKTTEEKKIKGRPLSLVRTSHNQNGYQDQLLAKFGNLYLCLLEQLA